MNICYTYYTVAFLVCGIDCSTALCVCFLRECAVFGTKSPPHTPEVRGGGVRGGRYGGEVRGGTGGGYGGFGGYKAVHT